MENKSNNIIPAMVRLIMCIGLLEVKGVTIKCGELLL